MALGAIFSFASWIYITLLVICKYQDALGSLVFLFFVLCCCWKSSIITSNFFKQQQKCGYVNRQATNKSYPLFFFTALYLLLLHSKRCMAGSAAYTHTCWLDPAASLQGMKYSSSSESNKHGIKGMVFKLARVGERQSLLVSLSLVAMAIHTICF